MNAIESTIYNEGTILETQEFYDPEDNHIVHKYIEYNGLTYLFSFFNGEFNYITRVED